MSNSRKGKKGRTGRISGGFIAIPWAVYDSPAYLFLGRAAKNLLIDIARQFTGHNNGRLICSKARLKSKGWNSNKGLTDAKRELLNAGFIYETVKGHRPNKASWYAITWQDLDPHPDYDAGASRGFVKCSFNESIPIRIAPLTPPKGAKAEVVAPPNGITITSTNPHRGTLQEFSDNPTVPLSGDHIDTPSARKKLCVNKQTTSDDNDNNHNHDDLD